ncbi:hypothetical protein D477_014176 [Arthrobacter crystallopoietes BAB-32]|uniref:Uncharacterized protein n=1 Tax=Arthrobacter crystallopoietes BAB-32 TaxID=1246476 RepID=N1UWV5_9MICC|nr:hypothetical protein [Arthrobacter crystallopoietes]EMY33555.1 hypothetical protein D477_014176 [Arthrobacter crystallopoietes BAB-32]
MTFPDYYAKQPPFLGNTVVEITVPSGRLIASDDLRKVGHFKIEPPMSINYGAGTDAWAQLFAKQANTAYAFVGNTCPCVTRQADGSVEVISPAWEADTYKPVFLDGENRVARICTDHWAAMLTDYQNWLDHGGPDISVANDGFAIQAFTVFEITPGRYRWTVYSHADNFDRDAYGRVTFARLELIKAD